MGVVGRDDGVERTQTATDSMQNIGSVACTHVVLPGGGETWRPKSVNGWLEEMDEGGGYLRKRNVGSEKVSAWR